MNDLIGRFFTFDNLIGTSLIKVIYFIGLVGIVVGTLFTMLGTLGMLGRAPVTALGSLIFTPILGLVGILFWRFTCELYIILFKISDDLTIIRDRTPALPETDS